MAENDQPLTDAEIAAFIRRLVRQIIQEETRPMARSRADAGPPARPPPALLPKDVAKRWGCSDRTVRNMIRDGRLPGIRIGEKLLRVRLKDVEDYEREHGKP